MEQGLESSQEGRNRTIGKQSFEVRRPAEGSKECELELALYRTQDQGLFLRR